MLLRLESDDVESAQHFEQAVALRKDAEHARRDERHVKEEPQAISDAEGAQLRRQRDQMVVVYPDQIVGAQEWCERLGEGAIDGEVTLKIRAFEFEQTRAQVQQRP